MRRLSASQIGMYRRCSLQYAFRYIFGLKMKPVGNMTKGRSVHKGVQVGYLNKAESGENPPQDLVLQAASDEFDQTAPMTKWEDGETPGGVKDRAIVLTAMHHREVMPEVDPVLVEHEMHYDIGENISMLSYADVITVDGAIRDTKSVGRKVDEAGIATDAQLAAYVLGAETEGLPVNRIVLDRLVDIKKPYVQQITLGRQQVDVERTKHVAQAVAQGIDAGLFHPCDDLKTCSWCGYKSICWGAKWWAYLKDPELARRAAQKVLADDLLPEGAQSVPARVA